MNTTKYIDITSAHRNRNMYPNPANFQVQLSNFNLSSDTIADSTIAYPPPFETSPTQISNTNTGLVQYQNYGYMYYPENSLEVNPLFPSTNVVRVEETWLDANRDVSVINSGIQPNKYDGKYLEYVSKNVDGTLDTIPEYREIVGSYRSLPTDDETFLGEFKIDTAVSPFQYTIVSVAGTTPYLSQYLVGRTFTVITGAQKTQVRKIVWYRQDDAQIWLDFPIDNPLLTAGDIVYITGTFVDIILKTPFTKSVPLWPATNYDGTNPSYATYRIRGSVPFSRGLITASTINTLQLSAPIIKDITGDWLWITDDVIEYQGTILASTATTFTVNPATTKPAGFYDNMYVKLPGKTGTSAGSIYHLTTWDGTTFTINPEWGTAPPAGGDVIIVSQV
jgi:hypothetical protein